MRIRSLLIASFLLSFQLVGATCQAGCVVNARIIQNRELANLPPCHRQGVMTELAGNQQGVKGNPCPLSLHTQERPFCKQMVEFDIQSSLMAVIPAVMEGISIPVTALYAGGPTGRAPPNKFHPQKIRLHALQEKFLN